MKATWSDRRWRRPAEARMFWAWRVRLLSLCPPIFDFLLSNTLVIHIIKVGFARYPRTLPSDTVSSSLAALKARNQDSALQVATKVRLLTVPLKTRTRWK
jgi:hypothetical protein